MLDVRMDITIAGRAIYNKVHPRPGDQKGKRGPRQKASTAAKKEYNNRARARKISMILDANFQEDSALHTLTYRDQPDSWEQAERDYDNFIRRLKRRLAKEGTELKQLGNMERGEKTGRFHDHIVLNTRDHELVQEVWGKGQVDTIDLADEETHRKLAEYLVKNGRKDYRDSERMYHRYKRSRNLIIPETKQVEVSPEKLDEEPQPIRGYYIPKESIRIYNNPVTGLKTLEFMQLPLDKPRRFRVWPRGKRVKTEPLVRISKGEELEYELSQGIQMDILEWIGKMQA